MVPRPSTARPFTLISARQTTRVLGALTYDGAGTLTVAEDATQRGCDG